LDQIFQVEEGRFRLQDELAAKNNPQTWPTGLGARRQ
jgi:hypothetical protein